MLMNYEIESDPWLTFAAPMHSSEFNYVGVVNAFASSAVFHCPTPIDE